MCSTSYDRNFFYFFIVHHVYEYFSCLNSNIDTSIPPKMGISRSMNMNLILCCLVVIRSKHSYPLNALINFVKPRFLSMRDKISWLNGSSSTIRICWSNSKSIDSHRDLYLLRAIKFIPYDLETHMLGYLRFGGF